MPIRFNNPSAELFVPDGTAVDAALRRVTHLGVGAHQDDLEFMALHGILACHERDDQWFGGVTCADGAGSPRSGPFAACSDIEMQALRRQEQNRAAVLGRYGAMCQLDYSSREIKEAPSPRLVDDLLRLFAEMRPQVVYTHNPADRHDTHLGVLAAVVQALRELAPAQRPARVIGCEVWRDLDWLAESDRVLMDVSDGETLGAALAGVFESQIGGGKRYDLAIAGRRLAHATFGASHAVDNATQVIIGLDLTPLVNEGSGDIAAYIDACIGRFRAEVLGKLTEHGGER